ncbi:MULTISPECIES: protein translocase subunit SecD [unclassified Marinimicrobium]|jgi:preprotein translocase subunit SecD|uniref:protein translocase subunit SecD n=1 Tax=Marinimicrobium TaxID=359337 RepID=UPI002579A590|nr:MULTISPECIES: protein translocase subunit SecD [unclassified Marinimicrobium]|tara:strand:- start:87 stop:1964 length:1878 start_codon:yes stop_codon:yes gene_type:complete
MHNRYPLWKYLLILGVVTLGFIYALPNLYAPDPAVQISGQSGATTMDASTVEQVERQLQSQGIEYVGVELGENAVLVRLASEDEQMTARRTLQESLGGDFVVALNQAPTTPDWLVSLGGAPMRLGLDLSGGVHFLLEVDTASAIETRQEITADEMKGTLREERIRYNALEVEDDQSILARFRSAELRDQALALMEDEYDTLVFQTEDAGEEDFRFTAQLSETAISEIEDYALGQNLVTLRNRVNELGVSEPVVQRQGGNRIIVQLPGVQDTAEAKRVIGKTANLEFRLEAGPDTLVSMKEEFPYRSEADKQRFGGAELERQIILTGDHVANATSSFDAETNMPQVNITLDGLGGTKMHRATRDNVGRRMGVLFIEHKTRTEYATNEAGETVEVRENYVEREIISLATIQSALGKQFRITGLESPAEASELALLLRAGALAAPMYFVEERTIGPSLGAENIQTGLNSVVLGLALVLVFMLIYYRVFGIFANLALGANILLLVAVMSLLGATLTLPGIAGIVLTVGMAVDANVLIFSRIREELKEGASPQSAIYSGYERAFVSILDANITTLLVAVILYAIGTGPVQGFAVTLSIGILTSMFTAIMGTRALANLVYGRRRNLKKIWI